MPKTMTKIRKARKTSVVTKKKGAARSPKAGQASGQIILEGLRGALAHARGEIADLRVDLVERPATSRDTDARPAPKINREQIVQLRQSMNLSQPVFARALNATPSTVRSWEQGVRVPNGPALRLLEIVSEHPELIRDRLRSRK